MGNIIEDNKLIAKFLEFGTCLYSNRVTNPRHPDYNKRFDKVEVFCLPDTHILVQNLYTDLYGYTWNYDEMDENGNTINRLIFFDDDLNFSSDWNWLMLAIEKIESLGASIRIVGYYHDWEKRTYNQTNINLRPPHKLNEDIAVCGEPLFNYSSETNVNKLKSTYQAVVKFIRWYNENYKS